MWLLDVFPNVIFTLLISYWSLMICFYVSALRDNRIELVRASWKELTISISDVSLSDEGQYTCSLFTMPVKTTKAFLTVLGKTSRRSVSLSSSSICAFKVNTLITDLGSVSSLPSNDLVFALWWHREWCKWENFTLADGAIRCVTVCFALWSACARICSSHSVHCIFIYNIYLIFIYSFSQYILFTSIFTNNSCFLVVFVLFVFCFSVFVFYTIHIIYKYLYRQLLLLFLLFCVVVSKSGGTTFTLFLYSTLQMIVLFCCEFCFFVCLFF